MVPLSRLLAVIGLALAAGCSGPVISHIDDRSPSIASYFRYYARDGAVAAEVHGAPPGVAPADFAAAVADALSPPAGYPPARFVATAEPRGFRMVLMFGAPPAVSGSDACANAAGMGLWPTARPFRVQGAMCQGARVLTEAVGTLPVPPAGPGDQRFRALLDRLSWTLLPMPRPENGFELRPLG